MIIDTGAQARAAVRNPKSTLKHLIYDACLKQDLTCYDLEDLLDRSHQSVSGTIRYMVKRGELEILPFTRKNKFNNDVRVYRSVMS